MLTKDSFGRTAVPRAVGQVDSTTKRLLIVDDERTLREVFKEALSREGYEVVTATSPEEALTKLREQQFDAVLLDQVYKASPFSGLDALRKIRESGCSVRVIMMTGYLDVADEVAEAVKEGAHPEVIQKPSTLAEISRIIASCLSKRES